MSLIALAFAGLMSVQPAPEAGQSAAPRTTAPTRSISARPAAPARQGADGAEGETRRVCSYERDMGSTISRRVCRDVPVGGSGRNDEANEFLRRQQGARLPDQG